MTASMTRLACFAAAAVISGTALAASPPPPPPPKPAPAAPPAASKTPGIAAYLTIDMAALANYAKPSLPAYYTAPTLGGTNAPPANPVSDKGATLGRVLFYDTRLSVNNTTACATCHQQVNGFGAVAAVSKGFLGVAGTRHAMRLGNVAYYRGNAMFWDKRAANLEVQSTQPIQNSIEMGYDQFNGGMNALLSKMQSLPYYPELFTTVFGDATITEERMQRALAQFMRSMVSANSRWDQGFASTFNPALPDLGLSRNLSGFTAQENRGKDLFMAARPAGGAGCAGCHRPPTFALDPNSKSNGLNAGETTVFKSPSLKDLTPGQALMHDGRFTTLEQVVGHYNLGVKTGPALDPRLKTPDGRAVILNISAADQAALVAFLKTLQDPTLNTDPRFSNPFKK